MFISLLRKTIPNEVRLPAYIVIIATFVTVVQLFVAKFLPELDESIGAFMPLIVVNCIILGRAEAFASKNSVGKSFLDGLAMGLGFTFALTVLGVIREVLGNGTILNYPVFSENFQPATMFVLAPGGFIVFGVVLGVISLISRKGGKS